MSMGGSELRLFLSVCSAAEHLQLPGSAPPLQLGRNLLACSLGPWVQALPLSGRSPSQVWKWLRPLFSRFNVGRSFRFGLCFPHGGQPSVAPFQVVHVPLQLRGQGVGCSTGVWSRGAWVPLLPLHLLARLPFSAPSGHLRSGGGREAGAGRSEAICLCFIRSPASFPGCGHPSAIGVMISNQL